jgi:uncharacterized damage-inducible protein DinB
MAVHLLVAQLRFARSEFVRCLEGVSEEDGARRVQPMNSISWMIGHLANQEQGYWLIFPGGQPVAKALNDLVGTGKPASTPPMHEMWAVWRAVTQAADAKLDKLTPKTLQQFYVRANGQPFPESIGTLLLRNIYHYWFHIGEAHAVRQVLGHTDLPQFVGKISEAPYIPE